MHDIDLICGRLGTFLRPEVDYRYKMRQLMSRRNFKIIDIRCINISPANRLVFTIQSKQFHCFKHINKTRISEED